MKSMALPGNRLSRLVSLNSLSLQNTIRHFGTFLPHLTPHDQCMLPRQSPFHSFFRHSLLAMALIIAIFCPSPAQAQGSSFTIGKHQLQQATFPKAPLQIQILDERPRVKDLRQPEQAPENFVIPIPPMPTAKGQGTGTSSAVRMEYNNLPSAGFGQSNIPAGGMAPARSLPTTKSGGLSPIDKPPRPIGLVGPQGGQRQLSVSAKIPTAAAVYSNSYDRRRSLLSGSSGSDQSVKKEVNGTLVHAQGSGR